MPKKIRILHNIFTTFSLFVILVFTLWWFNPVHIPNNFTGIYKLFDLLLFFIVSYVVFHPILMDVLSWAIASNIKSIPRQKPKKGLKVAFITTIVPSHESLELLHRCLPAMVSANYKHDTWLLDEENNKEAIEICKKYGVFYFSRSGIDQFNSIEGKFKKKTKGGNHNSWYEIHGNEYDIVAQIDTDFIPKRSFLTQTLGYFNDSDVAFVGTPQIYRNIKDSFIARGAAEQTYNFYGPILKGLSSMGMTLLIGANHVIRVEALKQVDHYSAHITEDLLTGMKLHKRWKSIYLPKVLAVGDGPSDWKSYFNQQMRWAYGCIDIFITKSPKMYFNLGLRRSIYYFFLQQHYFSGISIFLGIILIGLYFFTGISNSNMKLLPFVTLYSSVLLISLFMSFWMQRFNIRPKIEKGLLFRGRFLSLAVWPIFAIAFFSVLTRKRLKYRITPKGVFNAASNLPIKVFIPHLLLGFIALMAVVTSFYTHKQNIMMLTWAIIASVILLFLPFMHPALVLFRKINKIVHLKIVRVFEHYKLFEFNSIKPLRVPNPPGRLEKYKYITGNKKNNAFILIALISSIAFGISFFNFISSNKHLLILTPYLLLTLIYFIISLISNLPFKGFDLARHNYIKRKWEKGMRNLVDIFLPTAGESISVLRNTWNGVALMRDSYPGPVEVYCLDDSARNEVKALASIFKFKYIVRENRGVFKKAGNLKNGYENSNGEFIVIFDADFKPHRDFLSEVLPTMLENPKIGIVQSPQYFNVDSNQNWLERGAGAVQEFFYRFSQVSRQNNNSSICVGSNAVYRRQALDEINGFFQIEHSEDVHTGFRMVKHGWQINYIPIILAKGLCPSDMKAFFKQQYRWCLGSMTLLTSKDFWNVKLSFKGRISYFSGFLYYIHTGFSSFFVPLLPLIIILFYEDQINLENYLLILPSILFIQVIYPLWHKSTYGIEAWATRSVYGWAHIFAIFDKVLKVQMDWQPSGVKIKQDIRYLLFRLFQFIFNFIPALLWVYLSGLKIIEGKPAFIPLFVAGIYYFLIVSKVTFYGYDQLFSKLHNLIFSNNKKMEDLKFINTKIQSEFT